MQIPNIIKETCNGYFVHTIRDEMLMHREVECVGSVNEESVNSLILQLRYPEKSRFILTVRAERFPADLPSTM